MRLPAKIFISVIAVFAVVFLVSGYFLLSYSFENCVERERQFALHQYKYDCFTVQSGLIANEDFFNENFSGEKNENNAEKEKNTEKEESDEKSAGVRDVLAGIAEDIESPACFMTTEGQVLYDSIGEEIAFEQLTGDSYWSQVVCRDEESFILLGSQIEQDSVIVKFATKTDITDAVAGQRLLQRYYAWYFCAAMGIAIVLTLILSVFLTRPLKKMTVAADKMAAGNYHERLSVSGRDELGELAVSFNRMADAVEKAVSDLTEEARRKEDFVANFAHEIKTPLTSVIGYADRIYQKDLPREQVKKAAWRIWNEGMRLEALSFKLMDLTHLNRQKFIFSTVSVRELFQDAVEEMEDGLAGQNIRIQYQTEDIYVRVDCDLMKTLFLNLIDNAAKAECHVIEIEGRLDESEENKVDFCRIEVRDDGKGIPAEELSRITEAFYMVDKARSRSQHGAGLGLALVKRIVELHGGMMEIYSESQKGTTVSIRLPASGEVDENEE